MNTQKTGNPLKWYLKFAYLGDIFQNSSYYKRQDNLPHLLKLEGLET